MPSASSPSFEEAEGSASENVSSLLASMVLDCTWEISVSTSPFTLILNLSGTRPAGRTEPSAAIVPSGAEMSIRLTTDCAQLTGSCVTTNRKRSVAVTTLPYPAYQSVWRLTGASGSCRSNDETSVPHSQAALVLP